MHSCALLCVLSCHNLAKTKFPFFRGKPERLFFSLSCLITSPLHYKLPFLWTLFFFCHFNYIILEIMGRSTLCFSQYKYQSSVNLNHFRGQRQSGINLSLHRPFRDLKCLWYWNRRLSLFSMDSLFRFSGTKSSDALFMSLSSSTSGNPRKCLASKPSNRTRMIQVMRRLERANIMQQNYQNHENGSVIRRIAIRWVRNRNQLRLFGQVS